MNIRSHLIKAALVASLALAGVAQADPLYRPSATIPLSGEGGWDYLTVDAPAHRLYVAHDKCIVVIDTVKNAVVGQIDGLTGAHGFALAPGLDRGFASSGHDDSVLVVRLSDLKTLRRVHVGTNPDAIAFEPETQQVYACNGRSGIVTILAAATGDTVASVALGAKLEFAQADPTRHRVYIDLENTSQIAAIDTRSHAVAATWALAPGVEPSGLAFDAAHSRLFAGCDNERMMVVDVADGRVVGSIPAGAGIDACTFDPGTQLVFSSNGEDGTVTIAHEDAPDKYTVVQTLATEPSARTMQVDPLTHKIYLVSAKVQPIAGAKRPRVLPGTLKVLVYELTKPAS